MKTIWTIGHSNHSSEEFVKILQAFGIEHLVDVRRFPGSRAHPQFHADALRQSLPGVNIGYTHIVQLGGRRKVNAESRNTGWRSKSFQAYADFMSTDEFLDGITGLLDIAAQKKTAYMCSEALWWRCHRRLISDYLITKGWKVFNIMNMNKADEHELISPARMINGMLTYAEE